MIAMAKTTAKSRNQTIPLAGMETVVVSEGVARRINVGIKQSRSPGWKHCRAVVFGSIRWFWLCRNQTIPLAGMETPFQSRSNPRLLTQDHGRNQTIPLAGMETQIEIVDPSGTMGRNQTIPLAGLENTKSKIFAVSHSCE